MARVGSKRPTGLVRSGGGTRQPGPSDRPPPPAPPGPPGTINWTPLGPSVQAKSDATGNPPVSGRVTGIAVGPGGTRAYVGASNGGVWFTPDAGASWTPLEDDETFSPTSGLTADSECVADIAAHFDPSGPTKDTIFVLSGNEYTSVGVKASTQGGAPGTWTPEATNLIGSIGFTIAIDPDNAAQVFAATSYGLFKRNLANLANWQPVATGAPFSAYPSDIAIAGAGAGKRYYVAYPNDHIYVSSDFTSWAAVPGGGVPGTLRVALAASESNPSVVYALDDNARLLRLVSGSFQQVTSVPKGSLFPGGQGVGDIILGVDPLDPDTVYLGGDRTNFVDASLFKGTLTGSPGSYAFPFNPANAANPSADATWIGQGVHADVHSFAFARTAGGTIHDPTNVWVGTDGGLWQSTVSGAKGTFRPRNTGLATIFFNQLAQREDMASVVFGAGRDNGTFRLLAEQAARQIFGGDGGGVAVDPSNGYRIMICGPQNNVLGSLDSGSSWYVANFPPRLEPNEDFGGLGIPIYTSPPGVSPTIACIGTNRVWITSTWGDNSGNPNPWTTLPTNTNPYLLPAPNKYSQDQLDGPVRAIEIVSDTLVLAATSTSIYRFDLSGGTWSSTKVNMANIPANTTISALAVDSAATGSFYVTLGVFGGGGFDHVWYNPATGPANPGTGFVSALSHAQLDSPVNAAVVDSANPQIAYVGGQVGCWKGTKTGASSWTWVPFSPGLPEAAIVDLRIHQKTRLLRAALDGRGIWEIPLDASVGIDPDVYMRINYADDGRIVAGSRYSWLDGGVADPTRQGFNLHHWMSADIKVRRPDLPAPDQLNTPPDYLDFAINIDDYVSSIDTETATAPASLTPGQFNQVFVEIHNRGLKPVPGSNVRVLLLVTPVSAGLPALPAGYATHIQNGDAPGDPGTAASGWLYPSAWYAAEPGSPYKSPPGSVDVRTPGIVGFNVDLKNIPAAALSDHVCAAAFVTTVSDPLTSTQPSLDVLTMQDKHAVHRNLHLVAAGAKPLPGGRGFAHAPQTIALDFHNATKERTIADLVFERGNYAGHISVMLTRLGRPPSLHGFELIDHDGLDEVLRSHAGRWLERAGDLVEALGERIEQAAHRLEGEYLPSDDIELLRRKLDGIDRTRVYRAAAAARAPTISDVPIPAGSFVTAIVNLRAPEAAKPSDHYRFNIIQRDGNRIVGGSTYVYTIVEARNDHAER